MYCARLAVAIFLLLVLGCHAVPLKFIAVPITGNNSPALDMMGVAAQLQSRGHSVTVVAEAAAHGFIKQAAARHSSNTTAEAMSYLSFGSGQDTFETAAALIAGKFGLARSGLGVFKLLMALQEMLAGKCGEVLADANTMKVLRQVQADAVMALGLPFFGPRGDSCGCLLSHALNVPMIEVNGNPLLYGPANTPQFGPGINPDDLKTWSGYTKNLAVWGLKQVVPSLIIELGPDPWGKQRQQLGLPARASGCGLRDGAARLLGKSRSEKCESLLEVLLASWLLEYARPLQPNQVIVGPGTPRAPHAISPPEVAAFVDTAPAGVILVAFGSTIQASLTLDAQDFQELAQGFASLAPVRVLWPLREKALPAGMKLDELAIGDNTMVVQWVDYNDVLGHPHTKVFVSHCGLHSVYEAMYHGMPIVAVPFQMEQAEHATKMSARGVGVVCKQAPAFRTAAGSSNSTHYTRQHVAELIQEVFSNPSYSAAARGMSEALQMYAKRRHPYERAADEIELALNARHAQQQAQQAAAAGKVQRQGVHDSTAGSSNAGDDAVGGKEL